MPNMETIRLVAEEATIAHFDTFAPRLPAVIPKMPRADRDAAARAMRVAWASLPLRAIVGCGFMAHGCAKLSRGSESFAAVLPGLGVPYPHLLSWGTILVEWRGGAAVLAGAFLAIVSVP